MTGGGGDFAGRRRFFPDSRCGTGFAPLAPEVVFHFPSAMFKAVVKTIALLAILFVMLYVGMHNTQSIDFHFPIAGTTTKTPIQASAALVYFGIFAVGLIAGTILAVGGGKSGGAKKSGGGKDK